ncbi:MAG TPA: BTAD domain-containing putative transcriptional regulator [Ktedonobacteraceae bacterium]|nr:BTAD domain-containing putative transcriptional regulator [Ktedonobacteraceae bacterium]
MTHHLPLRCRSLPHPPLSSFVGRQREIAEIKRRLATTRLLTLTGVGGCGKTRLALQVATELWEKSGEHVCWVDLGAFNDLEHVVQAALDTLGACDPSACILMNSLKGQLLVLDSCEHLVTACTQLVEEILCCSPELRVLATSREALGIIGESVLPVPTLPLPDPAHISSLEALAEYEAIQLFVERAASTSPSFLLTEENAQTVAQICSRLDGIPLAIELVTTKIQVLAVEQIALRLNDMYRLLASNHRKMLPRHQTLRATLDWSYNLLSEKEQSLLHRLSALVGSFTLEMAEAACTGGIIAEGDVLDVLARLVDKSLVVVEERHGETYYRLLEMIRQYAFLRVQEALQLERTAIQHCPQVDLSRETCAPCAPIETQMDTVRDQPELRIFALGSARVYRGKLLIAPTHWKYAKARELLFYLLCHRSRTKEQIGLALWPDASPAQLRTSFHATLYHLRRAIGQVEWITYKQGLYAFNRQLPYWFDVDLFEKWFRQGHKLLTESPRRAIPYFKKAVQLYRADFLQDISWGNWSQRRKSELQKMYADALLGLGQLLFAENQYGQAADTYRQLIAYDRFQETAHRELMRCYERQGEHSRALQHYRFLAGMIREELGTSPARETVTLFERLLNDEAI